MTRLQLLIETIDHQLKANGYHLTDIELKDVAAHALMVLDDDDLIRSHSSPASHAALCARESRRLADERTDIDRDAMWRPDDHGGCWDFTGEEVQP